MKITVNLGDDLKHAKITLPKTVPVTKDFDISKILGEAEVRKEGENTIAELRIFDDEYIKEVDTLMHCGVAGMVTQRKNNIITGFDLKSVSIQFKP